MSVCVCAYVGVSGCACVCVCVCLPELQLMLLCCCNWLRVLMQFEKFFVCGIRTRVKRVIERVKGEKMKEYF